jgi:hypothetical protein
MVFGLKYVSENALVLVRRKRQTFGKVQIRKECKEN